MWRFLVFSVLLCFNCTLGALAKSHIFRDYDIRGIVDKEFAVEDGYDIARAIASYFKEAYPYVQTIALGADGRVHSPQLKGLVQQALTEMGYDVISIGTCITPVLYYTLATRSIDAGIMITASHNPAEYNGLKIAVGRASIYGSELKKIYDIYFNKKFAPLAAAASKVSQLDMISAYVDYLVSLFPNLVGKHVPAIMDCGNGAAGTVLPQLIEKMQWTGVKPLFAEVDGSYPNHVADPTVEIYMQTLKEMLTSSDYAFGIGFDGDCDRMAPMTKAGKLIKGDQLVALHSKSLLEKCPGATIIFDISSSKALLDSVKSWGGNALLAKTGAVNIKEQMRAQNAVLAGEISCHTMFNDRYFGYDDGMYSMLRLVELLSSTAHSLDQLLEELPQPVSSPLYRLPCEREKCLEIIADLHKAYENCPQTELIHIDGLRVQFPTGWAIVRPSNTEPVISMRFEAHSKASMESIYYQFKDIIGSRLQMPIIDANDIGESLKEKSQKLS